MSDTNDAFGKKGTPIGLNSMSGFPKRALNRNERKLIVLPRKIIPGDAMTAAMAEKNFKPTISEIYIDRCPILLGLL
jgi:hypothetical protein